MHGTLTLIGIVGLVAFAFGERTARLIVQIVILAVLLFAINFVYHALTDAPGIQPWFL